MITYDMLSELGQVIQSMFRMLYPNGLTMEQIEEKAEHYAWMRLIRDLVKSKQEESNEQQQSVV